MKKPLASEEPLVKIFSSDDDFVIPDDQRPYSCVLPDRQQSVLATLSSGWSLV